MIKLGKTVWLVPFVLVDFLGRSVNKPIPGTVVYINEPHRFCTVEFKFPGGGHYREAFKFDEIEDK